MKKIDFTLVFIISLAIMVYSQSNRGIQNVVPGSQVSEARTALVIGNAAYSVGLLRNPVNDARTVAAALRQLGFTVITGENLTNQQMDDKIREFGKRIQKGGVGLFYFSGHGVQVQDVNYLIPVDARIEKEQDVRFRATPADQVLGEMEAAGNRLNIVILDACRDNPFPRSLKTATRGLSQMMAPKGTIIEYATAKGATASDGVGANGLFTEQLVRAMKEPELTIEEVFKKVRVAVDQRSNGVQVPWESSNLIGDFYFIPPGSLVDLDKYESEASRIAANRSKWETWQSGMASAYRKVQDLDKSPDLPTPQKIQMWQDFLAGFIEDNPYSNEDETMRTNGKSKKEYWENPAGIEFVHITGGTFEMGDTFKEGDADEKPVHTVIVSDFYLGKTEVTVAQYLAFCNATDRAMPSVPAWRWNDDHPIVNVSWNEAKGFCEWAKCRLPTEVEWEYAARDGGKHTRFGNGKDTANPSEINFNGNAQNKQTYSVRGVYRQKTSPVASFLPNAFGLYDMSGNVWEWCLDWYSVDSYKSDLSLKPQGINGEGGGQIVHYALSLDPQGPDSGSFRVVRGGSWLSNPYYCRSSNRDKDYPNLTDQYTGFRVCRSP